MAFEMNEAEKKALESVKNGQTEFLFDKHNRDASKEELQAIFLLSSFGFVNAELYSDEEKIGHVNVSLTEPGRHHFMSDDEIRKEISDRLKDDLGE